MTFKIIEADLHPHLQARMQQRGVTCGEIERTINDGSLTTDAKPGTVGKVFVFPYAEEWEGVFYSEKEVTVYFKIVQNEIILLTVKTRYGRGFLKERKKNEDRV
jgi:hypothetical protein